MTQVNVLTSQHKDSVAPISEPVTCAPQDTARLQLLDTPEEWAEFSHPDTVTEGSWSSSVVFEGMHCTACAISIEDVLRAVPGVSDGSNQLCQPPRKNHLVARKNPTL